MTREEFRASPYAKGFLDLMDSQRMQIACDTALLHMLTARKPAKDAIEAAAAEFRRQGASEVLDILKKLTAPGGKSGARPNDNLNYKA